MNNTFTFTNTSTSTSTYAYAYAYAYAYIYAYAYYLCLYLIPISLYLRTFTYTYTCTNYCGIKTQLCRRFTRYSCQNRHADIFNYQLDCIQYIYTQLSPVGYGMDPMLPNFAEDGMACGIFTNPRKVVARS